jgi:CRP/FNR family cyclic AMP-dependent transcriptional regulator
MPQFTPNIRVLRAVPLFSLFSEEQLAAIGPALQHRSYARNACILQAGELTDTLYIILSGRARIIIDDGRGREVILTVLGPNEFFGEMSLIDAQPRSATVEAVEACEVLFISKAAFMRCLEGNFDAAMLMLKSVVGRLREADRKIASLALMDVYGRVARLLMESAQEIDGRWVVEPGSEQISRMVGASREMVSRVLKDLRDKGLIVRDKRKIIVIDRASIERAQRPS